MKKVKCEDCGEMVSLVFREYYYHIKDYTILGITEGSLDMSVIEKTKTLKDKIDTEIVCPKCETAYVYDEVEKLYGDSNILYKEEVPILAAKSAVIKATITKAGQQERRYGDSLKAMVRIDLPTEENQIIPELDYGIRCYLFGLMLDPSWGQLDTENQTRYETATILGDTWEECIEVGKKIIERQINPLLELIENRRKAWEKANETKNS